MTDRPQDVPRRAARQSGRGLLFLFATLFALGVALVPMQAWAQSANKGCWKITGPTTDPNSNVYTGPGSIVGNWSGAPDNGGMGAFPMTLNISAPPFVPDGTLLGSGVSSVYNMGSNGVGSYSPEQILFRCSPDADGTLYELYATNGDAQYAGEYDMSAQSGIPGTYESYYSGIVARVTNLNTGNYVTRYWQGRPLTGLDHDSQGWILVKAKNFSQYKLEFFQCSTCPGGTTNSGIWAQSQPVAYAAFIGGASGTIIQGNMYIGSDSLTNYSTFNSTWPAAINPYNTVLVRRAATCVVTNATPLVNFPIIRGAELTQGGSRQLPITIQMQCQTTTPTNMSAFTSGTAANQVALGILVQPANAQSAINAGLTTSGTGVSYLLSDGYGTDPSVATGVGVALSRPGGTPLNFLTNQFVTLGGANDGWDPVLNDATANGAASGGVTSYTRTINATFKAFAPGVTPVTAGKYNATAQVIIQVQ